MYWALTVIAVCQAAYISVISDGCCSMGRGRKSRRGGGGKRLTEKRDGGRVRVSSHSPQYVITGLLHYSTMLFLSSPPLPPSLLRSVSVLAVISSRSRCLTALCPATAHLSLPSAPRSPQWGWHPRIWWTSEALIPAGGFRGRPHMNGLTGRGGAASKELG